MNSPLPRRETLSVEFKSDRNKLSDRELIEAITCLANTDGGELWLGVEDNGTPTGLHPERRLAGGFVGLVAARTSPSHDGAPECVPMLPHDRTSRASTFGLADVSAQAVAGSTLQDFDPLERDRLRQSIQSYGGDRILLELDDEALDGALGLTARQPDGSRIPTLTGLLLVGREPALRDLVPTHEFAFQVMAQEAVRFNEFRRFPLLKALDWLETNFRPYNPEQELQVGLFRVPAPKVDMSAFREAIANALIHRDYHQLGAVHVRLENEALVISNPGGLVDGVTLANLLTTEPRPRNPRLADAMKRIGIVERSGRGVDTIYRGLLRYGRPAPNYNLTNDSSVVLSLSTADADLEFLKLIVDEENRQVRILPIDSLISGIAIGKTLECRRVSNLHSTRCPTSQKNPRNAQ